MKVIELINLKEEFMSSKDTDIVASTRVAKRKEERQILGEENMAHKGGEDVLAEHDQPRKKIWTGLDTTILLRVPNSRFRAVSTLGFSYLCL